MKFIFNLRILADLEMNVFRNIEKIENGYHRVCFGQLATAIVITTFSVFMVTKVSGPNLVKPFFGPKEKNFPPRSKYTNCKSKFPYKKRNLHKKKFNFCLNVS